MRRAATVALALKMPPRHVLRKRLRRHYERVSERFGGELYEVRRDGSEDRISW